MCADEMSREPHVLDPTARLSCGGLDDHRDRLQLIDMTAERFPTVVVGRDGRLGLVYLIQRDRTSRIELRWARLEVDAKTGVPSLSPSENLDHPLAQGVRLAPPVVSADGRSVFAANGSGKLERVTLPDAG